MIKHLNSPKKGSTKWIKKYYLACKTGNRLCTGSVGHCPPTDGQTGGRMLPSALFPFFAEPTRSNEKREMQISVFTSNN